MKPITRILARYVHASTFDALPAAVRHEGARAFVNWLGCAAAGSREEDVEIMVKLLAEYNGAKTATIVGRGERLDALNATFINSMSSAALAFNDPHNTTVAHPTSPVAAALLALAESQPLTGKELLHALILGIEVQCRAGNLLCVPPAVCAVGLSMQGLVGCIGAAAAAAKVMGLDESGITTAIGLAANQAGGLREAQSSMGSHFTPGSAARNGLLAALLAKRGFNCTESMLEGAKGFAASFASNPNSDAAIDKLGEVYEISTLAYKPYPSGVVIHSIIDACLEIVKRGVLEAGIIERIELTINPLAVKLCDIVDPRDRGQALVSLQHWAAVTLLQGAAGVEQVTDTCVRDPVVSEVRRAVVYTATATMPMEAADVSVVFKDGKRLQANVKHCRGSANRPLTDEDITEKTRGLLRSIYPAAKADQLLDQCWRMEGCARVDEFCKKLATD